MEGGEHCQRDWKSICIFLLFGNKRVRGRRAVYLCAVDKAVEDAHRALGFSFEFINHFLHCGYVGGAILLKSLQLSMALSDE